MKLGFTLVYIMPEIYLTTRQQKKFLSLPDNFKKSYVVKYFPRALCLREKRFTDTLLLKKYIKQTSTTKFLTSISASKTLFKFRNSTQCVLTKLMQRHSVFNQVLIWIVVQIIPNVYVKYNYLKSYLYVECRTQTNFLKRKFKEPWR